MEGIYQFSTLAPGILYLMAGVILLLAYPLNRATVLANAHTLDGRRIDEEAES